MDHKFRCESLPSIYTQNGNADKKRGIIFDTICSFNFERKIKNKVFLNLRVAFYWVGTQDRGSSSTDSTVKNLHAQMNFTKLYIETDKKGVTSQSKQIGTRDFSKASIRGYNLHTQSHLAPSRPPQY
jgi:hypothetical protein